MAKNCEESELLPRDTIVIDAAGSVSPYRMYPLLAGWTCICMTVAPSASSFREALHSIYSVFTNLDALSDKTVHVLTTDDILAARSQGKLGVLFALQNSACLEGDQRLLTILHRVGIRLMTLTYNERNAYGSGCMEPQDTGITLLGRRLVREMNRLGIILDLSHSGERTTLDAMEISDNPPIFSHSNPYALTASPRCITDRQIRAVASKGGVVGISVFSPMCATGDGTRPTLSDYVDRVEYVADLVGVEHVAIGTDIFETKRGDPISWRASTKRNYPEFIKGFDHETIHVKGFETHQDLHALTEALIKRGYTDANLKMILGGNLLRAFEANALGACQGTQLEENRETAP